MKCCITCRYDGIHDNGTICAQCDFDPELGGTEWQPKNLDWSTQPQHTQCASCQKDKAACWQEAAQALQDEK